jgi:hypothetical protein
LKKRVSRSVIDASQVYDDWFIVLPGLGGILQGRLRRAALGVELRATPHERGDRVFDFSVMFFRNGNLMR